MALGEDCRDHSKLCSSPFTEGRPHILVRINFARAHPHPHRLRMTQGVINVAGVVASSTGNCPFTTFTAGGVVKFER